MCGISGIVVPRGARVPKDALGAMTATLEPRGPDDQGYFVDGAGGCGLGHRRLSIIDLDGGRQPLANQNGRIQTVANGEIYNFRELRAELVAEGFVFRTRSDSEVVPHGFERWGVDLFSRLEGQFALAIWDARNRRLVLARDRMGQKPLYYAFVGPRRETLVFGSELKALAEHPQFERCVSPTALAMYLTYECVPEDRAIYRGAAKVLPGTFLEYDRERRRTRIQTFWRMPFSERGSKTEAARARELRTLIREGTKKRLVSDVPLGVLLSGGIDSSTVAAAMAQIVPADRIRTFSVSFADASFDESTHARTVSAHLGTQHVDERLSPARLLDILPDVAGFMCEPLGDASVIPTHLLSRFTREHVTVALGGDGGDELFLGYPTFQADAVARVLDRLLPLAAERRLGRAILCASRGLPVSRSNFSFDFKVKRFARGLGLVPRERHQAWMGSFMPHELERVVSDTLREPALAESPYATLARFSETSGARDHFDEAVYQYARLYLTADVLTKVDRASMACGLEVRAPLLDTRLVEFACAIPGTLRLRGFTTKYLLKQAVRPWLPKEIIERPKKGFGVPIGSWIRGPLSELVHDLLHPTKLGREGYFCPGEVQRMVDEHRRGTADHRKPLWTLLAFELWLERFGPAADRVQAMPAAVRAAG